MPPFVIATPRLDLVLQSRDELLAWIEMLAPADRAEVSPDWLARVRAATTADPWTFAYRVTERTSGAVVGSCAFKGPPDAAGVVEVAYGIEPSAQGRGFATEAAQGLVDFALASGQVMRVRAHTRHDNQASARVLAKCGFTLMGEVVDPEDGLVLRWERVSPAERS